MAREITYNNFENHLWYLCQISLQIMLLPIQTLNIAENSGNILEHDKLK